MDIKKIAEFLKSYDGPEMNIMEVCGSHTGAIAKNGIPGMLSPNLHLISGPGCPVCVTPSAYIDRLTEIALEDRSAVVTFGDLIRVPGSRGSLQTARAAGARVEMVYSPLDAVALAEKEKEVSFTFAAVGFETTTPVYAIMMEQIIEKGLKNLKLLTALKTMPEAIEYIQESGANIQGYLAPGHVSVVTGSAVFEPIARKYSIPFGVSGFKGEELLLAIYGIVKSYGRGRVMNFYPSVVSENGNEKLKSLMDKYFEKVPSVWRGIGEIEGSGRALREEFRDYDMGSRGLNEDISLNKACRCSDVLMGRIRPWQCPLFGKVCRPENPQGACMVSTEGGCYSYFVNNRED